MNDEYQTQHYWNTMKKSELKELIKEQIKSLISESEGLHDFFYGDDENAPKPQNLNKFRTKTYEVGYWTYDEYGGDPEVIEVEASNEEEALKKAKQEAPRGSSKFKIV